MIEDFPKPNVSLPEDSAEQLERQRKVEHLGKAKEHISAALTHDLENFNTEIFNKLWDELSLFALEIRRAKEPKLREIGSKIFVKIGVKLLQEAIDSLAEIKGQEDAYEKLNTCISLVGHEVRRPLGSLIHDVAPATEKSITAFKKFDMAMFYITHDISTARASYNNNLPELEDVLREDMQKIERQELEFRKYTYQEGVQYDKEHAEESIQILLEAYSEFIETIKDTEEYNLDLREAMESLQESIDNKLTELSSGQ